MSSHYDEHTQHDLGINPERGLSAAYISRVRGAKMLLRAGVDRKEVRVLHGGVVVVDALQQLAAEEKVKMRKKDTRGVLGNV